MLEDLCLVQIKNFTVCMAVLRVFTRTINGLKNKLASLTLSKDNNEVKVGDRLSSLIFS